LVLVRDQEHLLGIAQVESISDRPGKKTMRRCPECGRTGLKERLRKVPKYRCDRGHEFEQPREEVIDVTIFEAHYPNTFQEAPDAVPVAQIKAAAPRPSDQLSIEEIDVARLEHSLVAAYPLTRAVLARFYQTMSLDEDESAEQSSTETDDRGGSPQQDSYAGSMGDNRRAVLRTIKQRRGQRKFRHALMKRYGARCMVTGCALVDVLEAAHVWPYRGEEDNHPENGLLLRADIHTLFDLNLLSINPATLSVDLAPALQRDEVYAVLQGQTIGATSSTRPALEPLEKRWSVFNAKWGRN
jgi:hypothetical protein